MSSFELAPGVVVEPDRRQVFVMSPDGGIVVVDLDSGSEVWRSQEAAKPLTIVGDLLVSQAETPGPDNEMRLVSLDVGRQGEAVSQGLVKLPPNVTPLIGQSATRTFNALALPAAPQADRANVTWEYVERPLRGVADGPMQWLPGEAPPVVSAAAAMGGTPGGPSLADAAPVEPGGEAVVMRGEIEIDPASGAVAAAAPRQLDAAPQTATVGVGAAAAPAAPDVTVAGIGQPQFPSADGRHVMTSQRTAQEPAWEKYLWTVYRRDDGQKVGTIRNFVRYAPFFVHENRIVFQAPPHARAIDGEVVEEPLQIRAADLETGERLWNQPVRDTTDRDPQPP